MSKQGRDNNRAKRIVEQQKAAARRRRVTMWTTVVVVLVLVAAGITGYAVMNKQSTSSAGKLVTPTLAVDSGTAFAVGTGPITVDLYEDFMCPICHEFETQSGATVKQLIADKKVTVRYHPVAILDGSSNGTNYSTRAAGAAAEAGQEGKFVEYHDVLYANQPAEGSNGLTDAKLISLGKSVGLTSSAFSDAVTNKTYDTWADTVTETFAKRGYTGTPTIVVNGKQVEGPNNTLPSDAVFSQAVAAAAG
jgi:protein-disulfide isomerase